MTAPAATVAASPPHSGRSLDIARGRLIEEVFLAERHRLPPEVWNARLFLAGLLEANAEWREGRRLANLARPHHYVANPGDVRALCGDPTSLVGCGWVGEDNEFIRQSRSIEGKNICARCDALAGP